MNEEKALVIIPEIDFKGGGERVSYKASQVFAENDIELDILTNAFFTGKENVEKELYNTYGRSEEFEDKLDTVYTIEGSRIKTFVKAKYKEAYQWIRASELHKENGYDYIFTHYSNIHLMPEFGGAEVAYYIGPGPDNNPGLKRKILETIYLAPYRIANQLIKRKSAPKNYTFIANSKYSKKKFSKKFPEHDFEVVHPPVDTENFRYDGEEKQELIVNFSRISPDKRNSLIVEVAEELKEKIGDNYNFKIVGAVRDSERGYLKGISEEICGEDLEDILEIRYNVSFDELTDLLKSSEINLHFAEGESFGMTPVEALSAGNELIVHKSGAPWHDIVEEGRYGRGWGDKEELVEAVREAVEEDNRIQENIDRSEHFSEEKFRRRIERLFGL